MSLIINGSLIFPLEILQLNNTFLLLMTQTYGIDENDFNGLKEMIQQDLEEFPDKKHNIPDYGWSLNAYAYVIEFSQHYLTTVPLTNSRLASNEFTEWESNFIRRAECHSKDFMGDLMKLADFLNNDPLIELCAVYFAKKIAGRTADEIRKEFGIKNDFTEEELAEITQQTQWINQHK